MDRFGVFMENMRCKVTNQQRVFDWGTIVPCQIGFKDYKGQWHNMWIDIKILKNTNCDRLITKGDVITVSGRMDYSEYQGKPQWVVTADTVHGQHGPSGQPFNDGGDLPY